MCFNLSFILMVLFLNDLAFYPSTKWGGKVQESSLLDMVRAFLVEFSVPSCLWCKALSIIVYIINRLFSPTLNNVYPPVFFVMHDVPIESARYS